MFLSLKTLYRKRTVIWPFTFTQLYGLYQNYDENYQFRKEIESKGYSQQEFVNTVETNYKALLNEKNKLESREEKRKEIYQSAKDVYLTESEKSSHCSANVP